MERRTKKIYKPITAMKPHQQTEWYKILSHEEQVLTDKYTEECPWEKNIHIPFHSFTWFNTTEGADYWALRSAKMMDVLKSMNQKGDISPSMGVNTKPADRIEYKGRLIYFEYGTPNEIIDEVKLKLK